MTSVVIPNYNGAKLLEKNLPHVLKIGADEVIVVDDGSTDGSIEVIKGIRGIKVIRHEKNLGFVRSTNDGFLATNGDVVILLNSDVTPKGGLLKAVLPHFKDPSVFAVSFNEGKWSFARGIFARGLIEHRPGGKEKQTQISFWASGGSAAFDRRKWEKLGGMDTIYSPFYWEDIDISYRAQMRGWKILWEPKARVVHQQGGTILELFGERKRRFISERNQLLFFWKNITSTKFWLLHILWMPARLLRPGYVVPFLWAILKLPQVLIRRRLGGERKVSDEEILAKFQS